MSVENNLPGIAGDLLAEQEPTVEESRAEEVVNFEIGRTVRNTVREVGEVKRLSVAVLVDGTYARDAEGNQTYTPRSEQELQEIERLVRSAVGYDETRGDVVEVVNMQFAEIDTNEELLDDGLLFGFQKSDLLDMAEILTVAIMIVLVVMLVLQPMVARMMEEAKESEIDEALEADLLAGQPSNPALAAPEDGDFEPAEDESMVTVAGIDGQVKASSLKKIEEIIENYPVESVSVLRAWMNEGQG